jgi:hypothetical protein
MSGIDEQSADFFQPMEDEPIILAPPETSDFSNYNSEYIGEIDAAPAVMVPEPPVAEEFSYPSEPAPQAVVVPEYQEQAVVVDESSPMAKWNNEWQVILKERKDEENAAKAATMTKAEQDLATFQAGRETKREAKMAKNRTDEQDKLEAIEADLENDNSWQKVIKMIELNQDSAEGSVDCSRMRDVLICLKNDTARATILA